MKYEVYMDNGEKFVLTGAKARNRVDGLLTIVDAADQPMLEVPANRVIGLISIKENDSPSDV